ncbi:MAG: polysaccharide biosynthesis/export protein [Mucilaginibacter sp.]|nr:polysaccharide biosynthesis/export protein [Mucilaginibacter sp.]
MRQIFSYLIILLIFICTSCSDKQYQVLFQQKKAISDTSFQKNVTAVNEYRIKSQDILQIRNLQDRRYITNDAPANTNVTTGPNTDNSTYQVEEDGSVILPVLGHVQVAGLTRVEAQKLVEDTYRKNLLVNPIIELKITNLKVTMLGEIKGPGNYILTKEHTTLVEMIGAAGGITEKANETEVKIIRGTQKNPQVSIIDLSNVQSINDPRAILQNGDIIYIAQNKRASRSDNLQSFSIIVQPALLLFNTALIVLTLIRR